MTEIRIMDEGLSNKIAAGEVVERPKSIVKELVENALDAGSDYIKIFIENSGIGSISVEDNGNGMTQENAELCFLRHATSKLYKEEDLFQIHSLGFRGEALAAIASVAKVHLYTGCEDEPGTHINIEGGELLVNEQTDARVGTKIVVSQLFYNTPARLKHMRSIQTEYMHTLEYLQKMALARPDVRFEFYSDGREIFKTFGTGKLPETLVMIYGEKVAPMLLPFEISDNDFTVSGYITKPQAQRSNARVINLALNKRSIRHFGINRAILAGYGTLIPKGTYPIVALDVEVDAKLVDVNVHPAKLEVRLSQENQLEDLIKRGIQQVLMEENLIYRDTAMPKKIKNTEQMGMHLKNEIADVEMPRTIQYPTNKMTEESSYAIREEIPKTNILSKKEQEAVQSLYKNYEYQGENKQALPPRNENTTEQFVHQIGQQKEALMDTDVTLAEVVHEEDLVEEQVVLEAARPATAAEILQELSIIGQFDATYILAQRNESLYLIDQHAAQERIKYEEHMEHVRNMEQVPTQELLFPVTLRVEPLEMAALKDFAKELDRAGIYVEVFGTQDIRVTGVPSWIKTKSIEDYVRKAIDVLVENKSVDSALVREKELIMLSCKYSIKAHDVLNKDEMQKLIIRLSEMESPFTCPHGRPIVIEHTKYEVERWFYRV